MDIAELRQEAESSSVVAQTILGLCYLEGIDVEVDYTEAHRFLSAAAAKGAPRAAAGLARMHAEGLGIPKNLHEAVRLYEFAANAGEFFAQIELARIYSRGPKEVIDPQAALRWYSAAAGQEGSVEDCEELQEAKTHLSRFSSESHL